MSQLLAVALVCSAALAEPACTRETALDVIIAPASPLPAACLLQAQETAAGAGLPGEGRYLKIVCERRRS